MKKKIVVGILVIFLTLMLISIKPLYDRFGPQMRLLKEANWDVEIEDDIAGHLYELNSGYYYLIVSNGKEEEGYYVDIEGKQLTLSPPPESLKTKGGKTKVSKFIFSGPKFIYDLETDFGGNKDVIVIQVINMKNPQYFTEKPLILNKTIVLRKR
jgi:hypothetical protein